MWGRFKEGTGWTCHRLLHHQRGELAGGCQILAKTRRGFRFGYISKGPVLREETEEQAHAFWPKLREVVRREKLDALLIQPPDHSRHWSQVLQELGCLRGDVLGIISSTVRVDLSGDRSAVKSRLSRTTDRCVRQALRNGVKIRPGDESDSGTFFRLMHETCKRQDVHPNPPSEAAFSLMFRAFAMGGCARMTFAELNGIAVAGVFSIQFGGAMTIWKKGALRKALPLHAVDLLYHDALLWGNDAALESCDFGGVDRAIAEALLAGRELTPAQNSARDCFNLRFGAQPELLPAPMLFVPNPFLRSALSAALNFEPARRLMQGFVT
jgi:lipid II:glycine glycyltransferase (peptidoglycan interpeptide bridge formation enzyme)